MSELTVTPVLRVEAEVRRASSRCHSALLGIDGTSLPGAEPTWTCRECGQPCERVMSEPEKVIMHG